MSPCWWIGWPETASFLSPLVTLGSLLEAVFSRQGSAKMTFCIST